MAEKIKVVVITSNQLRHRYYVNIISQSLDVCGIVTEEKSLATIQVSSSSAEDDEVINKHFKNRDEAEVKLLGQIDSFPNAPLLQMPFGKINTEEVIGWIKEKQPDYILLYGSGIIKDPILNYYENKIINLHLGLSPYYRGSGTNFWPLVFNEPECVGATIHLAVRKVDAGSILCQIRPDINKKDKTHEIGTKALMRGVEAIPIVLEKYKLGVLKPKNQDISQGKVYRLADFNASVVKKVIDNFSNGMIESYLLNRKIRDDRFPIIELI
ncbi:MAG: formyltransferase family protein [Bacteroidetes bacterium]|nr:formyltransferase family protein [Bacteroidota bacterium]